MTLTLLLTFTLIVLSFVRFSFLEILSPLADFFHKNCLERLPAKAHSLPELKALVCGENFSSLNQSSLFIATGLIHLFVVSGAHLTVIKKILGFFPAWFIYMGLFLFAAACLFNPPVCRSLIFLFLTDFLVSKKVHWPLPFKLLTSGLICLVLQPLWVTSLSLQMSWLIGLALCIYFIFFNSHSFLIQQMIFFVFILPTLIFFQTPSFLIILTNLVFTPLLEWMLFPLSLLVWLLPFTYPFFDFLMAGLRQILLRTEMPYLFQANEMPASLIIANWLFIFSLHIVMHVFLVRRNRKEQT